MKKLLLSAAIVATTMFVACGPSAEEIAKKYEAQYKDVEGKEADTIRKASKKIKEDIVN